MVNQPYSRFTSQPEEFSRTDSQRTSRNRLRSLMSVGASIVVILYAISIARSQTAFTRIYGPEDQTIPMPEIVGTAGQQDASALLEMTGFRTALSATQWDGLVASGKFTDIYGNLDQATLTLVGSSESRLDVTTAAGVQSTRIAGPYGSVQDVSGSIHALPPATALGGIVAFQNLLTPTFPNSAAIVVDQGQLQVSGTLLHRITIETQAFPTLSVSTSATVSASAPVSPGPNLNITDFYFDPATHLLVKSASYLQLNTADRERYLIVQTYSDYQTVGGILVPLNFSQTMNGQPQWTLQLSNPTLQPSVDASYFHF
jgi:hypothetical protein